MFVWIMAHDHGKVEEAAKRMPRLRKMWKGKRGGLACSQRLSMGTRGMGIHDPSEFSIRLLLT